MKVYDLFGIQKCGIGIIIVNEFPKSEQFREGADQEKEYLRLLLKDEFSLEVYLFFDVTLKRMKDILLSLSGKKKKTSYPCIQERHNVLVIAISSHGESESVYTSDLKLIQFSDIKEYFNSENCSLLISKPKMLIVNCCRILEGGQSKNDKAFPMEKHERIVADGTEPIAETETYEDQIIASTYSDFITVCLCARGVVSLRGTTSGSLAIKQLYHSFVSYGHTSDFQTFMTQFTGDLKRIVYQIMEAQAVPQGVTQCPEVITTLDKPLIFPKKHKKKLEELVNTLFISPQETAEIAEIPDPPEEGESDQTLHLNQMFPNAPNKYILPTLSNQNTTQEGESLIYCESDFITLTELKVSDGNTPQANVFEECKGINTCPDEATNNSYHAHEL